MERLVKISFLLSLVISSLLLTSCGNPAGKTNLKVSFGAVTGSENFKGGLYILAQSNTGESLVQRVPDNDSLDLQLSNSTWSFAAVGWDSVTENYEGNVYCDHLSNISLTGGEFTVNLSATQAKCVDFASPGSLTSSEFSKLKFFSCMDLKPHFDIGELLDTSYDCTGGGDSGGAGPGGDQSFRISIIEKSVNGAITDGLESACVNGANTLGNFKFPSGNSTIKFPVRVKAYRGAGCTGEFSTYTFNDGLKNNQYAYDNKGQAAFDPGVAVHVYLHVDTCTGAHLTGAPYAATYGGGDYHLICTADQFINIGWNGTQDHTFELGKNLDFSSVTNTSSEGTYSYVANNFKGELKGRLKKVQNGSKALFNIIEEHPSARTYTGNLLIEDFDILTTGVSTQSYGIFANKIVNNGSEDLEIGEIYIDRNSSIDVSGDVSSYIGAFTGFVENSGSARTYIQRVGTLADVTTDNSTVGSQYVGGAIGKVYNTSGGNDSGIYIDSMSVGDINIPYISYSDSKQVLIDGHKNVGGIIGGIYRSNLRGPSHSDVKITSAGYSGGIIGSADISSNNGWIHLHAVDSIFEFVPSVALAEKVGGIVGEIWQTYSNQTFQIASAVADLKIVDNGNTVDKVGGIVGDYFATNGYGDLKIYNSKANVDVDISGDYQGGLIGYHNVLNVSPGMQNGNLPFIAYSVAQGYIGSATVGTSGDYRGGLVGWGKDADVYRSIAKVQVNGNDKLGGVFGYAQDSAVYESYVKGFVSAIGSSSSDTYVGGVAGELYLQSNLSYIFTTLSKVDVDLDYSSANISSCQNVGCGLLVGNLANSSSSPLSFQSIAIGNITDQFSTFSYETCGGYNGSTCPVASDPSASYSDDTFTECSTLIASGMPYDWNGSVCNPLFERKWKDYGYDATQTNYEYLAGNHMEPFSISSPGDWNGLSDDSFLMAKSYALTQNINFNGVTINPIGSDSEPFDGAILSNGYELQNMDFTASFNHTGIINRLASGTTIGHEGDPIRISNLDIDCGSQSSCGFIGRVNDSGNGGSDAELSIQVVNGQLTGISGSDCTGGIVGTVSAPVRIDESSFQGNIAVGGNGVGGFIGCVAKSNASGASFNDIRVDIDDSFVDMDQISGNNYIGGFIGNVSDTSSQQSYVYVRDSYVVFDKDNANSGDDIDATGGIYASGITGSVDLIANNKFEIRNVYVDTSTAQVPSNYRIIARISAGSLSGSDNIEDFALIWNSSASSASSFFGLANSSHISYIATSAFDLSDNASTYSCNATADGYSDWWLENGSSSRVLKLDWQNPNYIGD